ncbi:MAG: LacI family transcriptional regulator [Mesorhizobium amorphae]|nr:MAG: LacI family transcriptional regulator [Mesorhizobium amorphae]
MDAEPAATRTVTVREVAARAGVSKATAARVLGGYGSPNQALRDSVEEAARALGYQPNTLARSMTTGRSGTIGVVLGDIENPYFGRALRGISDVAADAGFDVLLANSAEDIDKERSAVRVLLGKQVDGLIVTPALMSRFDHLEEARRAGRPLVLLDRSIPGFVVDSVVSDDKVASFRAASLLLRAGHRRIAYISATSAAEPVYRGPHQIHLSTVLGRIEGMQDALAKAGLDPSAGLIRLGARSPETTAAIVRELFGLPARPTAILASDNIIALSVFKTIREIGLRIPDDVSLIAFTDADWTSVTAPTVTVIEQPVYELGRESARILFSRMEKPDAEPAQKVIATRLIERASVAGPPG